MVIDIFSMESLETIGARALVVRKEAHKTQIEMAKFLGLATATWQKIERDEGLPNADTLLAFKKLGINPGWLLTGLGPKHLDEVASPNAVDPLLMEKLYKAVERAYKDVGQRPPGHRLAHEATTLFNVLLGEVKDIRNDALVDAAIPVLARQLVERLMQAAAEPGTGKRSA